MDDLFRFLLLRPANPVAPENINTLTPSFVAAGVPRPVAVRNAGEFLNTKTHVTGASTLQYSKVAVAVVAALRKKCLPASDVSSIVAGVAGETAAKLAADQRFLDENKLLSDSLVAFKLVSSSSGTDAAGLAEIAQGYDAVRLAAASGSGTICLRPLAIPDFPEGQSSPGSPPVTPPAKPPGPEINAAQLAVSRLDTALSAFSAVSSQDFAVPVAPPDPGRSLADVPEGGGSGPGNVPWLLSDKALAALPPDVRQVLTEEGLDPKTRPLPVLLNALQTARTQKQMIVVTPDIPRSSIKNRFGNAIASVAPADYVGNPTGGLPSGHGNVRPTGIGDLLLVRQHVLRYEGGELAHVENVLKTEHLSRDTRRLERTETTVLQETETTKEETRDTQTTDRFSLKRETSDTIKTDSSLKAGVSVDAKYGPFVEVKANADFATSTSEESTTQQASEFSRDVVDRSTSKLVERVLERRTTTTITEFEEKYSHGFDNTAGSGHVSGFYQWIDKVMQAQIYNYGRRLLFDVTVPEPGTNYILSQTNANAAAQPIEEPPPFTLRADQISESNYLLWAKVYDTTGLEPPPLLTKTFSKSIDALLPQDPHETSKSDTISLDDGYSARYATFAFDFWRFNNARWGLIIGNNQMDVVSGPRFHIDLAGETGSLAIAWETHQVEVFSGTVEVFCDRTLAAFTAWQIKIHAAITQAYLAKEQAYQEAVTKAQAAAESVVAGRNPAFNSQLVGMELRRQCLTLVTGQQFDGFGALELSAEGYAQPNLDRTEVQMPYVRFFEQAFEWDHILYFFYPYFWGWKPGWKNRMLLDDVDPAFADFLRAGAARVVFPVRPGFEAAVVHYLETGEIWSGGPPPDITGSLYVPIIQEIEQATGAPGNEQPVGDPWEIRLPTTLVRIRPNDDLPTWQKNGEDWVPVN
jgi:hypothetical protein